MKNKKIELSLVQLSIVMSILGIFSIFAGSTYAIFSKTITSENKHVIKAGAVKVELAEGSTGIEFGSFTTMSDADGLLQDEAYQFSIKNIGDANAKVRVSLVDKNENTVASKYVKVGLEVNEKETGPFNLYEVERIIYEGIINQNKRNNYKLRLWIDESQTDNLDTLIDKKISYKLKVEVEQSFVKKKITLDKSGANEPLLTGEMIPVYYDETAKTWKKADKNNLIKEHQWYDYDEKMWANAVTVDLNKDTYLHAEPGTSINISHINSMWVWIPRYKYTYFKQSSALEIPIEFEEDTSSTGTIKCTEAISANSGKSENCVDNTNGSLIAGKSTYTHPAFTFGNDELTGLWIGKFETSNNSIKPNYENTIQTPLKSLFAYARQMEWKNNILGVEQNGTEINSSTGEITGDSNNIDTHMMKNTEWGVATYFSHSKYGLCTNGTCNQIGINNYLINSFASKTGCGATRGSSASSTCNAYDTETGKLASTTRNIYGIYDMSGGDNEYVMGNIHDSSNNFSPRSSGWSSTDKPLEKYYDKYSYGGSNTEHARGKLGDATYEPAGYTTSWNNNTISFPVNNLEWFVRGGRYDSQDAAGPFYYSSGHGGASRNKMHIVLAVGVSNN